MEFFNFSFGIPHIFRETENARKTCSERFRGKENSLEFRSESYSERKALGIPVRITKRKRKTLKISLQTIQRNRKTFGIPFRFRYADHIILSRPLKHPHSLNWQSHRSIPILTASFRLLALSQPLLALSWPLPAIHSQLKLPGPLQALPRPLQQTHSLN